MSNFLIDEDTDLLAAEFVLGTLDAEERANAQSLLRMDHGFIAMVRIWERRFGELHLMVEPVEPEAKIWQRIKAKIAEIAPREPAPEGKPPTEFDGGPGACGPGPAGGGRGGRGDPRAHKRGRRRGVRRDRADRRSREAGRDPGGAGFGRCGCGRPRRAGRPGGGRYAAGRGSPARCGIPVIGAGCKVRARAVPKVAIPAAPPLPPPALKLPDKRFDKPEPSRPARGPEITIDDVVRSRGRWRVLGVCMTLLVMGLVALLATWRFIPDRLPARLRPAQLMMSLGVQALPTTATAVRRAPPEAQFDE